jgi:hypothetical protein
MSRNSFGIKYGHCEQWGEGYPLRSPGAGRKAGATHMKKFPYQ